MMKNLNKILYWVFTGLFSLAIVGGASSYIFQNEMTTEAFTRLGFPLWLIYPMAIAKYAGVIAILQNKFPALKEWAYAAFTCNLLLAAGAHINVGDGEQFGAIMVLFFMILSYVFLKRKDMPQVSAA